MSGEASQKLADRLKLPDWSDRESVITYYTEGERDFGGTIPVDEEWVRDVVGRAWDRSPAMAVAQNHWLLGGGTPARDRLGEIRVPTLVLHGTDDPLLPYVHGQALAREIRGARLVPLTGMGHGMPPRELWDITIEEILAVSEAGR
ncbi:alpha/beta hydrolase [Glaciihabitans sp. UYNi722]|uniref:alpha/beta fold hydrolase n=1 Tax=Glaciihabitans sp. UYNi722 TaxID=3156344 RepID=UPI0033970542